MLTGAIHSGGAGTACSLSSRRLCDFQKEKPSARRVWEGPLGEGGRLETHRHRDNDPGKLLAGAGVGGGGTQGHPREQGQEAGPPWWARHSHTCMGKQRPAWNIPKWEKASKVDTQQTDHFLTQEAEWPPL